MLYDRRWGYAASFVVAAILLGPALMLGAGTASAQVSFIGPTTDRLCMPADSCMSDAECDDGATCVEVLHNGSSVAVCQPPLSARCCGRSNDGADRPCPDGERCESLDLGGIIVPPVCVPREAVYCDTHSSATHCHTGPRGPSSPAFPVAWQHGDCDQDGIPNGVDSSPCDGPPEIGFVEGNTCQWITTGCANAEPCSTGGDCALLSDGSATYCHPHRDVLFCCPHGVCPGSLACTEVDDSLSVCIPPECGGNLACVTDDAGNLVPFIKGDCDEDGVPNGEEPDHRADSCPLPDGGVPADDAGPNTARDAGTPAARDASADFDGGSASPVQPGFAGGGGCACRSAPGQNRSTPWLALAPLALLLATRRR